MVKSVATAQGKTEKEEKGEREGEGRGEVVLGWMGRGWWKRGVRRVGVGWERGVEVGSPVLSRKMCVLDLSAWRVWVLILLVWGVWGGGWVWRAWGGGLGASLG
jgi:hypothetical protein